jgi:hypothetical protein
MAKSRIAATFLILGSLLLVISVFYGIQIVAFIGLGLTFWGAIFVVTRTGNFVDSGLLESSAKSLYSTIDRMLNDLNYSGQGYYIPAYPQNVYLPDYLKNLKESVVFISDRSFSGPPAIEELASGKFLSARSRGIFITSPGSGILSEIEKKMNLDFTKINVNDLCGILSRCMTDFLNLAKAMELFVIDSNTVRLIVTGVLYESLYDPESNCRSVGIIGCPLVSAVACALAKSSGKTVAIKSQTFLSSNSKTIDVLFSFVRG